MRQRSLKIKRDEPASSATKAKDAKNPKKEDGFVRDTNNLQYFLREFRKYRILDAKEIAKLVRRWRQGDLQAREKLIVHNTRLVVGVARQYSGSDVPLSDRIQLGLIGLMASLEKFDPKLGSLSNFAIPRIRNEITRGVNTESNYRPFFVPVSQITKIRILKRGIQTFLNEFKRYPTDEEIYQWIHTLDGTEDETSKVKYMSMAEIAQCQDIIYQGQRRSLDAPIRPTDPESGDFTDIVRDQNNDPVENLENMIEMKERIKLFAKIVETGVITRQEFEILMMRMNGKTLEAVGKELGVSRERIRQREVAITRKIKKAMGIDPEIESNRPARKTIKRPLFKTQRPKNLPVEKLFEGKRMTMPKTNRSNFFPPKNRK